MCRPARGRSADIASPSVSPSGLSGLTVRAYSWLARGAMRALGWLLVALGVLLAVSSFVVVAIVPTANPWPILGVGLALIMLGIVVLSSEGRNRRKTIDAAFGGDQISHDQIERQRCDDYSL